ncbi:MAG: methyltransferase, partial [Lactobacillus sp.]|nr:methyltransferase [Lactobacillus sp.]
MIMHYYTNNVDAHSDEKSFNYRLRGYDFRFTTDVGVFSKKEVDFGSRLLIESFTVPEVEGDILDVGCGYGPIGLSLAKSYENRNIHMVDVNHRALELAK